MKLNFMLIFTLVFIIACQKSTENDVTQKTVVASTIKSENNITPRFKASDSVGEFTGLIKRFVDTTEDPSSHVVLLDGSGDSTTLYFLYSEVNGVDKRKMKKGSCVTIKYRALIDREGGEETGRSFFMTDIKYK